MANISTIKVGNTSYGITATPTAHASTATTYGAASASKYGHVKLSDNYTSSAGTAASGIAASSAAVYNAYNTLNSNLFANMSWKVLMKTNVTTRTQFTVPDLTTFKLLSLELRFSSYIIAQIIIPAATYADFRSISGSVDGHSAVGQLMCDSATSVNAFVVQQVNNTNIYVMLRGIKEK